MKIDSITFGRTKSLTNEYGNIRIGFSASLAEGEDWHEKLKELEDMTDTELAARISRHATANELDNAAFQAKQTLYDTNRHIVSKQKILKQLTELLDKHGVVLQDREAIDEMLDYDPFAEE